MKFSAFSPGDKLIVDYHVNHITGSCWLMATESRYDKPGCTANHSSSRVTGPDARGVYTYVGTREPDSCEQMLRLLKQDEVVTALMPGTNHRYTCSVMKVVTSDGIEGWVSPAFFRAAP